MKYGKTFRDEVESRFPEWKREFISYKKLKRQLKTINPSSSNKSMQNTRPRFATTRRFLEMNKMRGTTHFTRLLASELNKVNKFYFDKEEEYIIRLKEVQVRAANLEMDEEKLKVQNDMLAFHAEMVSLLHYSVLNFTGVVKIVKKHNKRASTSFQFSSITRVMLQPFFSTDLLYKLMMECEKMIRTLRPFQAGSCG